MHDSNENNAKYSPLEWNKFFQTKRQVALPIKEEASAMVFTVYEINAELKGLPVIVLHHGLGHCALSFAATARELHKLVGNKARIISLDSRGHGETTSMDQSNLDVERLGKDLQHLLQTLYGPSQETSAPEIFLVGHSMGGTVVSEAAHKNLIPNLTGITVVDFMEDYKAPAFVSIVLWCNARPQVIKSLEQVIQWGVDFKIVRNIESARVSFPGMVGLSPDSLQYLWRSDPRTSQKYWAGLFDGHTQRFLGAKTKKLLILAGQGNMNDEMKDANEQGNFELLECPEAGHAVQEDVPEKVAERIFTFWKQV